MKRKGFTLVELLVVIAIIALLMGVLMPALARVRQIAYRMICGTNLSGIGKAMVIYANDNEEEYPVAGGRKCTWTNTGAIKDWLDQPPNEEPFGSSGKPQATITSCLFLLVKYADVTPKQYVCKGDVGTKPFKLSDSSDSAVQDLAITEVWDFGDGTEGTDFPGFYCSYSYHMPLNEDKLIKGYPITAVSEPSSPVCGDRNPYQDKNAETYLEDEDLLDPTWADTPPPPHYSDPDKKGNAAAHQREGQNVLFNDSHVSFEKTPNCGIENDNIWLHWTVEEKPTPEEAQVGTEDGRPTCGTHVGVDHPRDKMDAFLVGECNK